ncbi:MAG: hypothetical protein ACE5KX_07160 [Acidimicrobiia bacterium]
MTVIRSRTGSVAARLISLVLLLAACRGGASSGTDDAGTTSAPAATESATTTAPATASTVTEATAATEPLPPPDRASLVEIFGAMVEPMGLRITRASLVDRADFERSPTGTHLALYVEPIGDFTADQYAQHIVPLAQVFLPLVFDRWPGLESFDVCQEPPPEVDDSPVPPSVTVVEVTRQQAEAIDWAAIDLAGLIAAYNGEPGLTLAADHEVRVSATWQAASAAAREG